MLEKIGAFFVGAIIALPLVALLIILDSYITYWAWNTVVPHVWQLPTISLWQAFAFNILVRIVRGNVFSAGVVNGLKKAKEGN